MLVRTKQYARALESYQESLKQPQNDMHWLCRNGFPCPEPTAEPPEPQYAFVLVLVAAGAVERRHRRLALDLHKESATKGPAHGLPRTQLCQELLRVR